MEPVNVVCIGKCEIPTDFRSDMLYIKTDL
jgi:hypothetical protein